MTRLVPVLWVCICVILCGLAQVSRVEAQPTNAYTLGSGDKVHVIVFGEQDLTGDYDVDDQGFVALPLIGQVHVGGMTMDQAQQVITQKYGANYLVNPRVSVGVVNYRPFFILGEVKNPGSYPYVSGMTVLNAIALAGGYTPRGNPNDILVKHANNSSGSEQPISESAPVLPGDIIRVRQKLF
ncbi:MAG TPA: polysaccharide biosynthesis/export family protein [Candidatus Binataceae bacterium]|nr:polysaccharide biosynthesis/export family protein [Candidatus Binataceae bacterium]